MTDVIGRVLRASTRGFVGALRLPPPDIPTFGAFCRVGVQQGRSQVYGIIYDIRVDDDLFARQVATADDPPAAQIADHRHNRQVPVEYSVLSVGYRQGDGIRQVLPPQPPMPLDLIVRCTPAEVAAFCAIFDYFRLVLGAVEVPADELLAAAIRGAAAVQPAGESAAFLRDCGRQLARQLSNDGLRLESLLERIRP